jgi:hypothetical protein
LAGGHDLAPDPAFRAAIRAAGLQQYLRRLEEMGFNRMPKLLRLGRADKLDALLVHLRFMPGHRLKFVNLLEEERTCAQQEAAFESAALFFGGGARVSTQAHADETGSHPAARGRSAGRSAGGRIRSVAAEPRGRGRSAGARRTAAARPLSNHLSGPPLPLASQGEGLHSRDTIPELGGGEDVGPAALLPIDAESAAVAFFQLSWVQAMLAPKEGEAALLPTLREDEGTPGGESPESGSGAGAAAQADVGRGIPIEDGEEYESDFDSEDEAAATLRATLRGSLDLQATASGQAEAAAAPSAGGLPAPAAAC